MPGYSQNYFERIQSFDAEVDEGGLSVIEFDSDLFVMSKGVSYELPRKYFLKYSKGGNLILNKTFSDFGGRGNCFHKYGQNLIYTGVDLNKQEQTTLLINTSGFEHARYKCVSDSLMSANIAATTLFGKYLVTSKNSFNEDETDINTSLCWLNLITGIVDTMIIEDNGFNDQIGDLTIGPDSLLTIVYMFQDEELKSDYYRSIHKFNKEKEKVWEWTSEKLNGRTLFHGFTLSILEDGRMVHTNGRLTYTDRESVSIRAINPDGSLSWYYDFPVWLLPMPPEDFFQYDLAHHITTKNNDIVGCGWYNDVDDKAYLFRMSSEGEMLWERYYYTPDNIIVDNFGNNRVSGGVFIDVEELENGDLAVVGEKHIRSQNPDGTLSKEEDMWLLRLNADGCIGDYCGEDRKTMITTTEEVVEEEALFTIYPNPSSNEITIEAMNDQEITIVSSTGIIEMQMSISAGSQNIDISDLPIGIYFIRSFLKNDHSYSIQKLIKI